MLKLTASESSADANDEGKLAALAVRLLLTFEPSREAAVIKESELVEGYMRWAHSIPAHRENLRTSAPSEPILAEAAARVMAKFDREIITLLSDYLRNGLIEKGQRGELVWRTIVTKAHDLALHCDLFLSLPAFNRNFSVPIHLFKFLKALVGEEHMKAILASHAQNVPDSLTFKDAFEHSYIHFTHFAKAGDNSVVSDEAAYIGMLRGIFWQCSDQQTDIDGILALLLGGLGTKLGRWVMSAIFWQIKNKKKKQPIHVDAEKLKFFSAPPKDEPEKGASRPYIVITMQLGVQKNPSKKTAPSSQLVPGASVSQRGTTPSAIHLPPPIVRNQPPHTNKRARPMHPRYEINIIGCSPTVYNVIKEEERESYNQLLASHDLLSEHPRQFDEAKDAVLRSKPFWKEGRQSFGWVQPVEEPSVTGEVPFPAPEAEGVFLGEYQEDEGG